MRYIITALSFIGSIHSLSAQENNPGEILILEGENLIPISIEGRDMHFEVSTRINAGRVINPELAEALNIKSSWVRGQHRIGPEVLEAQSKRLKINYNGITKKDRLFWFNSPASQKADGVMSPISLPYEKVVFKLQPKTSSEKDYILKMKGPGMLGLNGGWGMFEFEDQDIRINFDMHRAPNLVNAPAGNLISLINQGQFIGESKMLDIRFGVERPVREMQLDKPLNIAGLELSNMLVRISDDGDATNITEKASDETEDNEEDIDYDEIIVTGKKKKKQIYTITLGRDFLSTCSSVTYDLDDKKIIMSCIPQFTSDTLNAK